VPNRALLAKRDGRIGSLEMENAELARRMASLERLISGTRTGRCRPRLACRVRGRREKPAQSGETETQYLADTRAPAVSGPSDRHSCVYAGLLRANTRPHQVRGVVKDT
jgi:hypothetical protein